MLRNKQSENLVELNIPLISLPNRRNEEYDEAKGVEDVQESGRQKSEAIYNLQGIRLKEPVKGLYIKNGKKIMAR